MFINWKRSLRKVHYWGALLIIIPMGLVLTTGILLQVKKQVHWVQPNLVKGDTKAPTLSFAEIIAKAAAVPEAEINGYADITRIDVRSKDGTIKVRSKNNWEIQMDQQSGDIVQLAYRRSDLIEKLHDGSWFHDTEIVKLGVFLPSATITLVLWLTGMYMFGLPYWSKWRRRQKAKRGSAESSGTAKAWVPAATRQKSAKKSRGKFSFRKLHYWGSAIAAIPILIVLVTGILLLVKNQVPWLHPPVSQLGQPSAETPRISFDEILATSLQYPETGINDFTDMHRLEVWPGEGVIKVRSKSDWEIQLNPYSGDVLQVAYRPSGLIEDMHDGQFFHPDAKLWVFLPSAIIFLALWLTGIYLFVLPFWAKRKRRRKAQRQEQKGMPSMVPGAAGGDD